MITIIQTVDGVTNFSGTGTDGLILFESSIPLPANSPDIVPVLTNVALQGDDLATITIINCFLQRQTGTATERIPIRRIVGATGFTKAGCRIPVPRDRTNGFLPWQLQLITTGKSVTASLIVSFEAGMAVVGDG